MGGCICTQSLSLLLLAAAWGLGHQTHLLSRQLLGHPLLLWLPLLMVLMVLLQDPEINLLPHVASPAELLASTYSDTKYTTPDHRDANGLALQPVSGTSFAAPYTAGAIALALQIHRQHLKTPDTQGIAALQGSGQEHRELGFNQEFVNSAVVAGALQMETNGMHRHESTSKQGAGGCLLSACN